ncbi:MAG TPA: hypothetical protein VFN40_07335 [Gemmatimonadales bacterium]|nr:hypothetical protein [Gemmatimonadales bacterium]
MIPTKIRWLVLCAALAACGDKAPKIAQLNQALPNIPLPPAAKFIGRTGGPDALQVTVRSPAGADEVANYYRGVFKTGNWKLVNDAKDAEGATVLFAQQNGPPLWVRIRPAEDGAGTVVELSGAVLTKADSAAAKPAS